MNLADLVEKVATLVDTKKKAKEVTTTIFEAMSKALKKGDKVTVPAFGVFSVSKRAARKGRNPHTGEPLKIKASKTVKFKVSKTLKEKL